MKFLPFIFVIALLAGCETYHPQPLSPDKTAAQYESRRLDDPGLKTFLEKNLGHEIQNWPLQKWDLDSLTLAAIYFHPDLAVARAQWRVAEAGVKTAGARPNPSVTVTPAYDTQIPNNPSPWMVPVSLDIPIETAGKRSKRIAEAQELSRSAYWSLISAAWKIRADVRANLVGFTTAAKRMKLLDDQLSTQEKIVKLLRQRFDAGEISRSELTTAEITLNKTRVDDSDARTQNAVARSQLAQSLGITAAALDGMDFDFDFSAGASDGLTSAEARRVALLGRSDIRGALADYAAAQDDLQLQVAKQYPDLHLGPGYAWNSGQAKDNEWSLGLTVELPVLDQNQGPIAEAKARRELVAAQFIALQARVIGEIDRAVADYHAADEQLKMGRSLFAAEQAQQKSVARQREIGEADESDLAGAEMELSAASLAQLDSELKFQTALGALEDALQRPAESFDTVKMFSQKPDAKKSKP